MAVFNELAADRRVRMRGVRGRSRCWKGGYLIFGWGSRLDLFAVRSVASTGYSSLSRIDPRSGFDPVDDSSSTALAASEVSLS